VKEKKVRVPFHQWKVSIVNSQQLSVFNAFAKIFSTDGKQHGRVKEKKSVFRFISGKFRSSTVNSFPYSMLSPKFFLLTENNTDG
jgi:hypothetical protein